MLKKVVKSIIVAIVFMAMFTIPLGASEVEAANLQIKDVLVEKDGNYYALSIAMYMNLKAANVPAYQQSVLTHVKPNKEQTYLIGDFFNAKAVGGSISEGFVILAAHDKAVQVDAGTIEVSNGDVIFNDGEIDGDFKVIEIK